MAERWYKLLDASGNEIMSEVPGAFGGYRVKKIYGRLDCWAAIARLPNYSKSRVFFLDEATAIAAGYRPCAKCMKNRYDEWNKGGIIGTAEYPWRQLPPRFSKRNDVSS
jgi:Metal binding domain of Ada